MKGNNQPPNPVTNTSIPNNESNIFNEQGPSIYAASLSDYNGGRLHGDWVSANQEPGDMQRQIDDMLTSSTHEPAEEWAIHDYRGFGSLALSEHERLETVAIIGKGIVEYGLAYADFAQIVGTDQVADNNFDDHYRGHFSNLEAYAQDLLDDLGIDPKQLLRVEHAWLNSYIRLDLTQLAVDLTTDLEITLASPEGGRGDGRRSKGIHVFEPPQ